ncbi:hypothetical protein C1645_155761 [Glomus cerebriforme]|uniref:Uncharacterized protein n=1 Tax=Glomus cerebriforme TaxID=658196 RepID=A0A397T0I9_9GLOM|nr:hypothetical protein C1645_155761 [Glomus cerebriforme]
MVVPFVSKLRHWLRTQRKIARKRAAETSNHDESTEVVIYNGHVATSNVKEISPETSVPGTESEGSPNEQSPNISAQLNQFSPQIIDSQNILNSILLNRSTSTQPIDNSILMSQEETMASSMQFKQNHSYFSTGLPDQSPQNFVMDHSATSQYHLPELGNLQTPNTIFSEELNSQKHFLKGISRSNSQTPIHNRDITAPIPIHANTNVAIAALDPEQKLRRNSLLSLFTASTSARPSSSTPAPSITAEYDTQRRNSLLNVLQPETSVITPSKNLTHDDIVQHQLQQSKVRYFPDSYDNIKSSNELMIHPLIMNSRSETILNSTFMRNLRDPAYNENSSQSVMEQKISSTIGHIGQGRPSNNSDNSNYEIHEVARKMSLLGLFTTASNGSSNINISSVDTPVNTSTNYPSIIQQLGTSGLQGTLPHANITDSSRKTTLSQGYGRAIDESDTIGEVDVKNNRFMDDCIQNNYNQNKIVSHEVLTNLQSYDINNHFVEASPNLRVHHELLDRIHASDIKSQENNLCHAQPFDKNPMISFKFDIEKIVAAL